MKIIIEVKQTAKMGRIEAFDQEFHKLWEQYDDVVEYIIKEW